MERRVVLVAVRAVVRRDLQPPREVGGPTEEFLVDPVAPSADSLSQRDRRRERPGNLAEPDTSARDRDLDAQGTEADRSPDPLAALPDVERSPGVAAGREVELGIGEDVVDPASHDAEWDRPERVSEMTPVSPPRLVHRFSASHMAATMPTMMHTA